MTDLAEVRRELEALRMGLRRRAQEARSRPFVAPDLGPMRERIAHLTRALKTRDMQRRGGTT